MEVNITLDEKSLELIGDIVCKKLETFFNINSHEQDELLTVDEAAAFLKRDKATVYQLVSNAKHGLGNFPYLKQGRRLRFSRNALLKWSTDEA